MTGDDVVIKVDLAGLVGNCSRCNKDEGGTNEVYFELDNPIPGNPKFDLPEIVGGWKFVCDDCLKPDDVRPEPGEEFVPED